MGAQCSREDTISTEISFSVCGELHKIAHGHIVSPDTSLNDYLRDVLGMRDTKVMCREGGCGACVVAVTIQHPANGHLKTLAVNSCLIPVFSCHGWDITTSRGLAEQSGGAGSPEQRALAQYGGSQCGYCSSGMVLNMHALRTGSDVLTPGDVEDAFSGNLCRCTGYRPILAAFKSLAVEAPHGGDIEDLPRCREPGAGPCPALCRLADKPLLIEFDDVSRWYKVYTIQQILELFRMMGNDTYRLVAGNTGKGVYKISTNIQNWIDVQSVKDLTSYKVNRYLMLGGNVSLADTMEIMLKLAEEKSDFWYLRQVRDHLSLVANVPVRNTGTIAGNLSLKHEHHEFPSDVFLLLETINAKLTIVKESGPEISNSPAEYLNMDMRKSLIKSITIEPITKSNHLFESYKIMPRAQNAHAYVNAGFLVEHDGKFVVKSARIVYGGINPTFIHAKNTEMFLVNKYLFDEKTIQGTLEHLHDEIKPDHVLPDATPEFRKNLALNLFYKFILASAPEEKLTSAFQSGGTRLTRELSTGVQIYQTNEKMFPLTKPVTKVEALSQCTGEALYINDMPKIPGEVFGAFVLANAKPLSKIKQVDTSEAMGMSGVIAYIDHQSVPGTNTFTASTHNPTEEQLFCTGRVLYYGQPIGVIVAESQSQATAAVERIKVTYESTEEVPHLTIKSVLDSKDTSRIQEKSKMEPKRKGDDIKHVIKNEFSLLGQYHFTMETQCCVCVPTDDGGYDLYAGTQWMDQAQAAAAKALNLHMNKINVMVKRLGGAYGAKILRASMVSTACAVVAHNLKRPTRLLTSLSNNMEAIGKRLPVYAKYEAGINNDGVIQYLDTVLYASSGTSGSNEEMVTYIPNFIRNTYAYDTWKLNAYLVKTDMAGNCYARAPGACEAIALIETIMDHISFATGKDPLEVRKANLLAESDGTSDIIQDILTWSEYEHRKKEIDDYNNNNRWMKKGLSIALMNYHLELFSPHCVFISVYYGDGSVAISHGGVEMGQGINTKVIQVCSYILNIPMDMISIKPSNSLTAPNNVMTGGSITSEAVCYATIKACEEILNRLAPVKEKMKNPTWQELVIQAQKEDVEMCATHMFTSTSEKTYDIHGACVCEVQVDILTGEHNIARVDLIEDVGRSMSPALDVGQIEGAFVMGLGFHTTEKLVYGSNGQLLTHNTWHYKIPGAKDIPADFRIKFKQDSSNPDGVLNSKATGEPALTLSVAVPLAIRRALASARSDADKSAEKFVTIDGPTTVEFTLQNTLNDFKSYTL